MNVDELWRYAFILILVLGILLYIKKYADMFLSLKRKEIELLANQVKPARNTEAHERMLLFLERIKPSFLVTKFGKDLAVGEYIYRVEQDIQKEYEYNVSQQLYIQPEVWSKIMNAKNDVIRMLHETQEKEKINLQTFKTQFIMKAMAEDNKIADAIIALQKEIK